MTSISILPIAWYFRKTLKKERSTKKEWAEIMLGSLLAGVAQWFMFSGLKEGYPGIASVIFTSASPLFTFLLSIFLLHTSVSKREIFALFLGISGVLVIFRIWEFSDSALKITDSYFLLASFSFALSTIINQRAAKNISPVFYSLISAIVCTVIFTPLAILSDIFSVFSLDIVFWLNILFYGCIAGGVGTTMFFVLANKVGSNKASSFILTVPIFGVIFGYIIFDEHISLSLIIGGGISVLSVMLINRKKRGLHGQTAWRNKLED